MREIQEYSLVRQQLKKAKDESRISFYCKLSFLSLEIMN